MKILMVIANEGFRDEEFKEPFEHFRENDIQVSTASEKKGRCIGKFGLEVHSDFAFDDVTIEEYSAIVLVGGPGSKNLVGNEKLEEIIIEAASRKILVCAICYAPVILAKSGILAGRKATVYNEDDYQRPILEENQVTYVKENVCVDGMFITANGPASALEFAQAITEKLCQ